MVARFSSRIHSVLRTVLNHPIALIGWTIAVATTERLAVRASAWMSRANRLVVTV
jgi:hypothetical protein